MLARLRRWIRNQLLRRLRLCSVVLCVHEHHFVSLFAVAALQVAGFRLECLSFFIGLAHQVAADGLLPSLTFSEEDSMSQWVSGARAEDSEVPVFRIAQPVRNSRIPRIRMISLGLLDHYRCLLLILLGDPLELVFLEFSALAALGLILRYSLG